jgi:hypothetical protein
MFLSGPYSKSSNFRWNFISTEFAVLGIRATTSVHCDFASVPVLCSCNASAKVKCCTNHYLRIRSVSQTQYNLFLCKWQLPSKFPVKCSSHIRNTKSTPTLRQCICFRLQGRPTTNSSSLQQVSTDDYSDVQEIRCTKIFRSGFIPNEFILGNIYRRII